MSVQFLTQEKYAERLRDLDRSAGGGHWQQADVRWMYHEAAISIAKNCNIDRSNEVLELGTMGVSCVVGSHTMDFTKAWNQAFGQPTINHDAKIIPWPIADKSYKLFIALRVFQHLYPVQRECFNEAKRIADNVLIVTPEFYQIEGLSQSAGISYNNFTGWNSGRKPSFYEVLPQWAGSLFFWDRESMS